MSVIGLNSGKASVLNKPVSLEQHRVDFSLSFQGVNRFGTGEEHAIRVKGSQLTTLAK